MSLKPQHSPPHGNDAEGKNILTPRGNKMAKNAGKIASIFGAGALAVLAFQNCGGQKNYNAPNQRPLNENPAYHNNGHEITITRLLAASNMFNAGHGSLASDSFSNLYDQIDNTLDQKVSLFSKEQNAHLNHGNNGKDSYHAYIGINKQGKTREIYVSWHLPEPTPDQKAKRAAVATHKIRFVLYPGQDTIQRFDSFANGNEVGPTSNSYEQLQEALKNYETLFR